GGLPHGIFKTAAYIFGLTRTRDFPEVYRRVRAAYEAWKCCPMLNEAEIREITVQGVQARKERLLPFFVPFYSDSIRKAPSYTRLWQALPQDLRDEEFGGSIYRFRDFLEDLAREDPTDGPFQVEKHEYGKITRFRLSGEPKSTS